MSDLILKVAARYKSKKVLDSGTTVYEYSERQIANRHREKADRLEKLKRSIDKLRRKVKSDLGSSDPKACLTALAVALIDHTYERVGNEDSADDGHFGVTGWQRRHVSFGKGSATIKYVGKSGVKHEKKVTDASVLKALRKAYEGAKGKETCLFEHSDGCVSAKDVNEYLSSFDVTAKDLRGFHANREMQERLKAIRGKGSALPEDKKAREKKLKEEFKQALEATAEAVGHEPSTLKSQYLVPMLEEAYLKDGTVIGKLNEKKADTCSPAPPLAFSHRIIRMLVDHMVGSDVIIEPKDYTSICSVFERCGGLWERVYQGDPVHHELLKTVVTTWAKSPNIKRNQETV